MTGRERLPSHGSHARGFPEMGVPPGQVIHSMVIPDKYFLTNNWYFTLELSTPGDCSALKRWQSWRNVLTLKVSRSKTHRQKLPLAKQHSIVDLITDHHNRHNLDVDQKNTQKEVFTRGTGKDGGFQMALWWQPGQNTMIQSTADNHHHYTVDDTVAWSHFWSWTEYYIHYNTLLITIITVITIIFSGDDTCGLITRCRRLVDTLQLLLGGHQVFLIVFVLFN